MKSVLPLASISALLLMAPSLAGAQQQDLAPLPTALPRTHTPQPTTSAITAADLMTRLYIFADDSMRGRAVGSLGNAMGTTYLAAELKRMKLQPGGDSGTYFQNLPNFRPILAKDVSMRVGSGTLGLINDFLPIGTHSLNNRALGVIYGGQIDTPLTLTPAQVAGKLVVFLMSASMSIDAIRIPQVAGAAAIAIVGLDFIAPSNRVANMKLNLQPEQPVILLSSTAAKQLFGKELNSVSVGIVGQKVAVAYSFVSPARNVIAILPGSDPVLRHEYVALGAHNDHLGSAAKSVGDHDSLRVFTHYVTVGGAEQGGNNAKATSEQMDSINAELAKLRKLNPPRQDSIFNGADDDGSGSVSLLEIAEHLAAMPVKPKRSIIFVWHTGEEVGLLGSDFFTQHPTIPRDSIVVQLNADMIGRGDSSDIPGGGPNYVEVVGSRNLSAKLGDLIDTVNSTGHHGLELDFYTGEQYYTRSDHYNYARFGIPIAFFITGVHPDYHQVTDEPQYIDYKKMARIALLISDVAVHLANLDHRLIDNKQH
jgi:hypothetical protein